MAELRNKLKAIRGRLGLSQQQLATAGGVSRQTIGGMEAGQYAPSAMVALKLARALGCTVEELFWLDDEPEHLQARLAQNLGDGETVPTGGRVELAQVGGQWVAHSLAGDRAFRSELVPTDGMLAGMENGLITVRLLDELAGLQRTVLLAGCAPALSLWARSGERWHPGLRVGWLHANSTQALAMLAREEVHIAGIHFGEGDTGEGNLERVRRAFPNREMGLVTLGMWEEGLLLAPGLGRTVRSLTDVVAQHIGLVNREVGAGSRLLLDAQLAEIGADTNAITGYERVVGSHQEVAQAIATGQAQAGVSTASLATLYGLDFVPLRGVRYELVLTPESRQSPWVQQLLDTLDHRSVRAQLSTLGGYDLSESGQQRIVYPNASPSG